MSGKVDIYISENLTPKRRYIATEIASISVSVATLLLLPVWGTVSTSGLYFRCEKFDVRCCLCLFQTFSQKVSVSFQM